MYCIYESACLGHLYLYSMNIAVIDEGMKTPINPPPTTPPCLLPKRKSLPRVRFSTSAPDAGWQNLKKMMDKASKPSGK